MRAACGLISSGSGYESVTHSCKHGAEPLVPQNSWSVLPRLRAITLSRGLPSTELASVSFNTGILLLIFHHCYCTCIALTTASTSTVVSTTTTNSASTNTITNTTTITVGP